MKRLILICGGIFLAGFVVSLSAPGHALAAQFVHVIVDSGTVAVNDGSNVVFLQAHDTSGVLYFEDGSTQVPAGMRLVVDTISGESFAQSGQIAPTSLVLTGFDGTRARSEYVPFILVGTDSNGTTAYSARGSGRSYYEAGMQLSVMSSTGRGVRSSVFGHLVPAN